MLVLCKKCYFVGSKLWVSPVPKWLGWLGVSVSSLPMLVLCKEVLLCESKAPAELRSRADRLAAGFDPSFLCRKHGLSCCAGPSSGCMGLMHNELGEACFLLLFFPGVQTVCWHFWGQSACQPCTKMPDGHTDEQNGGLTDGQTDRWMDRQMRQCSRADLTEQAIRVGGRLDRPQAAGRGMMGGGSSAIPPLPRQGAAAQGGGAARWW